MSGGGPGHRLVRCDSSRATTVQGREERKGSWKSSSAHESCRHPHLRLVADGGHAAVIYEGEDALGVVAGDELRRLTNVVHVGAVGRACDLQGKAGLASPSPARAALPRAARLALRFGASGNPFGQVSLRGLSGRGAATHLEPADSHEAKLAALAGVRVIVRQRHT